MIGNSIAIGPADADKHAKTAANFADKATGYAYLCSRNPLDNQAHRELRATLRRICISSTPAVKRRPLANTL
jgi:hypothetical protein